MPKIGPFAQKAQKAKVLPLRSDAHFRGRLGSLRTYDHSVSGKRFRARYVLDQFVSEIPDEKTPIPEKGPVFVQPRTGKSLGKNAKDARVSVGFEPDPSEIDIDAIRQSLATPIGAARIFSFELFLPGFLPATISPN